jgi:hypothetical protein
VTNMPPVFFPRAALSAVIAIATMLPSTRHYVSLNVIHDNYKDNVGDIGAFRKEYPFAQWEQLGGERFKNQTWVPGVATAGAEGYQLGDAMKLCTFVLHPSRILATQSAVLFHRNWTE